LIAHPAINWISWAMAVLFLLPHVRSWWRTHVLMGGIDSALIRQTLYLCRFTGNLYILVAALAMMGLLVGICIIGPPVPSGVIAVMMSVALVPVLRLALPPAVLFLAGSSDRANALFFRLNSAIPMRVVALLDPGQMGPVGRMLRLDLMRTSTEDTWKSMVHRLIDIAPVYVVDTVHRTGPLRYEAFLMLAPERAARAVFISNDEGVCPSLLEAGIDPSEYAIPVTREDDMEVAAIRLLRIFSGQPEKKMVRTQSRAPVVREDWESLPSVLMIVLADGLDGDFLLDEAHRTDKSLIALAAPLSSLNQDAAKLSLELSWDFSRDPRLVGLYLQTTGLAMIRREFLLEHPDLLDINVPCVSPQKMSFDDLNKPEPVGVAMHELCRAWRKRAKQNGLEFRFAQK